MGLEKYNFPTRPKRFSQGIVERMSMKYNCVFCDYSSFNQHMIGHILAKHKDELAVEKNRLLLQICAKKGNMMNINIKKDNVTENVKACFGCKKFWSRDNLAENHQRECTNLESHKSICKSLLPVNNMIEQVVETSDKTTQMLKEMRDTILKLERTVARLEKDKQASEKYAFMFDKMFAVIQEDCDEETKEFIVQKLEDKVDEDDDFKIDWSSEFGM